VLFSVFIAFIELCMPELNGAVSPRARECRVSDLVKFAIHPPKKSSLQLKNAKVLWLRLLPVVPIYYLGVAHPAYAQRGSAIWVKPVDPPRGRFLGGPNCVWAASTRGVV